MELLELIKKSLESNQDRSLTANAKLLRKWEGFRNHKVTQNEICYLARLARNEASQTYYTNRKQLRYKAYILQDVCQSIIDLTDLGYEEYSDEEITCLYSDNFDHDLVNVEEITNLFE